MAKAQGLYTIVDARTAFPAVYVEGGIRADGVTVTPYPGSDVRSEEHTSELQSQR